jgi:Ca-activated chloride channel family protein
MKGVKGGKLIEASGPVMRLVVLQVVAGALALAGASARAQEGKEAGQDAGKPVVSTTAVFRGGVERVVVAASVRDARGRVVRDLKKTDFEVIDTGFGRPIQEFYSGNAPISLAVLLDISGSMGVGGNMDRARYAVGQAMTNLSDASDEAALFTFDSTLEQVVGFTKDLDRVRRVSLEGTPWGKTSLFDAIAETARSVAARDNRHRAVLVITDGVDTASRLSAPQVSAIASSIDVPIYLLTVVNPLDHPGGDLGVVASDGRVAQTATLADLARWTGGDMRIASVPAHTVKELNELFAELRHQYLIIFEPGPRPGWHPLEIRTPRKNLVVHARSGYTTAPSPSGS